MTGSRNGLSLKARDVAISFVENNVIIELHHGDCLGADADFHNICADRDINIVIHPPKDAKSRAFCTSSSILPPKDYLDRNKDIVNAADIIIAFPGTYKEVQRSGTWATIRYAKKMGKKLIIVYPDGRIDYS